MSDKMVQIDEYSYYNCVSANYVIQYAGIWRLAGLIQRGSESQ